MPRALNKASPWIRNGPRMAHSSVVSTVAASQGGAEDTGRVSGEAPEMLPAAILNR